MKQTYQKVLLFATLLIAAFMGIVLALSPIWKRSKEQRGQKALLLQLEQKVAAKDVTHMKSDRVGNRKGFLRVALSLAETMLFAEYEDKEEWFSFFAEKDIGEIRTKENRRTTKEIEVMQPETMPKAGAEIGILTIPKINAKLPITAGVSEEQLKISEGWVIQTAPIGREGNAVIAGHRSYTWGQHFNRLEELEVGDEIFYTTVDGEMMYFLVSEILITEPDDPAVFASPSVDMAQLTLYTCTPIRVATHRLIVRALRIKK